MPTTKIVIFEILINWTKNLLWEKWRCSCWFSCPFKTRKAEIQRGRIPKILHRHWPLTDDPNKMLEEKSQSVYSNLWTYLMTINKILLISTRAFFRLTDRLTTLIRNFTRCSIRKAIWHSRQLMKYLFINLCVFNYSFNYNSKAAYRGTPTG